MILGSVMRGIAAALCLAALYSAAVPVVQAQNADSGTTQVKLVRAVMCETIENYEPVNPSVVFSITTGQLSCFTVFEDIDKATYVTHRWYRRDDLVTTKMLKLKPPRWSTYSRIQLREADKGPWRVEIRDDADRLMETLRFSVTD